MNTRTIAIVAGTAVLAGGAAVGVAAQGETTPASPNRSDPPGMTRRDGDPLASLANELGVSETRLHEALEASRSSGGGPDDDMAEALADELGISVDKVRDALESAMPQRGRRHNHRKYFFP